VTRSVRSKCVECDISYCVDRNCLADCHTNWTIFRISFRPSFAQKTEATTKTLVQQSGYSQIFWNVSSALRSEDIYSMLKAYWAMSVSFPTNCHWFR